MFVSQHNNYYCKCTRDFEEIFKILSENIYSQYFSGCKSISIEVFALNHFRKLKPYIISMAQFYSRLSDEIDQGSRTTVTHLHTLLQFLLTQKAIAPLLTIICDDTDCCANQYHCASDIYLLSFPGLDFYIIIDRAVG